MSIIWQGLVLGLSVAAPVGPIGLLCIRRTLAQGRLYGLLSGLGAATADAIYGTIAALGLTALTSFLLHQQDWIRVAGGVFLCYLAYKTLIAKPESAEGQGQSPASGRWMAYLSTLLLTLTNPMTIISFAGMFAGFSRASSGTSDALLLVAGVFAGSALWWLALASAVGAFKKRLSARWLRGLNIGSGLILLIFGITIIGGTAAELA